MSHGYCTFDLVCITWCYSSNHVAVNIYASSRTKVSPPCDEIRKAHPQSPLASWTTMQNIMNEHITLCTKIVEAVRAPVSPQRAYPVCSSIHRYAPVPLAESASGFPFVAEVDPLAFPAAGFFLPCPESVVDLERPCTCVTC